MRKLPSFFIPKSLLAHISWEWIIILVTITLPYYPYTSVEDSKDYPSGVAFEEIDVCFSPVEKIDYQVDTSIVPQNNYTILAPGGKIGDYTDNFRIDSFPIVVKNIPQTIDANFGLAKICINISHRRVSDLKVELLSPDGSSIWLTNRNGGDEGMSYMSTCFRSNGFNGYIHQGEAPFTGEYIPDGRIEFLNNGQNPNGTWYLKISQKHKSKNIVVTILFIQDNYVLLLLSQT